MRDPKRIDALLTQVREIWEKNPDLRLGQLIGNVIDEDEDPYNVEDEILAHRLDAFYTRKISPELALALEAKISEELRSSRHASLRSPRLATPDERAVQERDEEKAVSD